MDLIKINIIPNDYKLNFGLNSEVSCSVSVYVTDFNGTPVFNYAIIVACPDDSTQLVQTGLTDSNGLCTFNYTFSDTNGTGYRRFVVNDIASTSVFLYRDTGWVAALDYKSGYSTISTIPEVRMRVVDKTVELRGIFQNNSAITTPQDGSGINVATMKYPQFAPNPAVMTMLAKGGIYKYFLELTTSGNIWLGRHGLNTTNLQISANSWLRCFFTYTI